MEPRDGRLGRSEGLGPAWACPAAASGPAGQGTDPARATRGERPEKSRRESRAKGHFDSSILGSRALPWE